MTDCLGASMDAGKLLGKAALVGVTQVGVGYATLLCAVNAVSE